MLPASAHVELLLEAPWEPLLAFDAEAWSSVIPPFVLPPKSEVRVSFVLLPTLVGGVSHGKPTTWIARRCQPNWNTRGVDGQALGTGDGFGGGGIALW